MCLSSDNVGIAEGADVARELATLAVVRARLPAAAAALAAAVPRAPPHVARPLQQILQVRTNGFITRLAKVPRRSACRSCSKSEAIATLRRAESIRTWDKN